MTVSDWLKNSHVSITARHLNGFGAHRSKINSVNEHATLDGVVYFFSFEFTKLLTLFKDHL